MKFAGTETTAAGFRAVRWTNTLLRRTNSFRAQFNLLETVTERPVSIMHRVHDVIYLHLRVKIEDNVRSLVDKDSSSCINVVLFQCRQLVEELWDMDNATTTKHQSLHKYDIESRFI